MIMKLCNKCKKPISNTKKYCSKCLDIVNKQQEEYKVARNNKYNKTRDPKYKQFYNSKDWKLLKEKKLLDIQYRCEICGHIAVEVHHIKPIQTEQGWILRLTYDNLEALCTDCHNYRHKRFQKRKAGDKNVIKTNSM